MVHTLHKQLAKVRQLHQLRLVLDPFVLSRLLLLLNLHLQAGYLISVLGL